MTMDILTYLCYGNSINAMDEPEFKAPLVEAMHTVTPLAPMLQHFWLYKYMIQNMPPNISVKLSPETAGLVRMQEVCSSNNQENAVAYNSLIPLSSSKNKSTTTSATPAP
jgi:hypothetical protein